MRTVNICGGRSGPIFVVSPREGLRLLSFSYQFKIMETKKETPVIPVAPVITVHVLVIDASGAVRGMYGGINPVLAAALSQLSNMESTGITRRSDVMEPLGQDVFDATYASVIRLSGLFFTFLTNAEIDKVKDTWPESFRYVFVVTR